MFDSRHIGCNLANHDLIISSCVRYCDQRVESPLTPVNRTVSLATRISAPAHVLGPSNSEHNHARNDVYVTRRCGLAGRSRSRGCAGEDHGWRRVQRSKGHSRSRVFDVSVSGSARGGNVALLRHGVQRWGTDMESPSGLWLSALGRDTTPPGVNHHAERRDGVAGGKIHPETRTRSRRVCGGNLSFTQSRCRLHGSKTRIDSHPEGGSRDRRVWDAGFGPVPGANDHRVSQWRSAGLHVGLV